MLPVRRVEPNGLDRRSNPSDTAESGRSGDDCDVDSRDDDKASRKQQASRMTWRIAVVLLLTVGVPMVRLALDSGRRKSIRSSALAASSMLPSSTSLQLAPAVDAVAFIVAGDLTTGPGAALAVEALRGKGLWDGPIVLLTDRPSCLSHLTDPNWAPWKNNRRSLLEETAEQRANPSSFRVLSSSKGSSRSSSSSSRNHHRSRSANIGGEGRSVKSNNADLHVVTVPSLQGRGPGDPQWVLAVKALKTRLFDVITEDQVPGSAGWSRILYLDLDVWCTRPLQHFLDAATAAAREEHLTHEELIGDTSLGHDAADQTSAPDVRLKRKTGLRDKRGPVITPENDVDNGGHGRRRTLSKSRGSTVATIPARKMSSSTAAGSRSRADLTPNPWPWLVLFYDCKAHAMGWCSGCDRWNTGVMIVSRPVKTGMSTSMAHPSEPNSEVRGGIDRGSSTRGTSRMSSSRRSSSSSGSSSGSSNVHPSGSSYVTQEGNCLKAWQEQLESGAFPTDQEALEQVATLPGCHSIGVVSHTHHLLFLKDYLALPRIWLWDRQWPTFVHVTAANRIETQDALYIALAKHLHSALGFASPFQAPNEQVFDASAESNGNC